MSDMDGYRDPLCPTCGLTPCDCPTDADAPILCVHGKDVDTWCAACTVAASNPGSSAALWPSRCDATAQGSSQAASGCASADGS